MDIPIRVQNACATCAKTLFRHYPHDSLRTVRQGSMQCNLAVQDVHDNVVRHSCAKGSRGNRLRGIRGLIS